MKKLLIALGATLVMVAPAFAEKRTVKFEFEGHPADTAVFDMVAKTQTNSRGVTTPYTFDSTTRKLCGTDPAGKATCLTLGGQGQGAVGEAVPVTTDDGQKGTMTLLSIEP